MNILIVSATPEEIKPLLDALKDVSRSGSNLYVGSYGDHTVDVLLTGVGMTATAYHCGKQLDGNYDLAINAGICGSFNRNLEPGAVLQIYEDRFAELGAEDGDRFLSLEELNLPGVSHIHNSREHFNNPVIHEIPRVTGITVNTTHGNEKSIAAIYERYHPFVESMEGAAFMFACEQEQIPYIQIRAVSNYVEKRNRENWNIPLAIANLNKKVMEIIQEFK